MYSNSEEHCVKDVIPEECSGIIPYTTVPNELFNLTSAYEYGNFSEDIEMAMQNCSLDEDAAVWGVCNIMFPRCLAGYDLQLCRNSCLGKVYCLKPLLQNIGVQMVEHTSPRTSSYFYRNELHSCILFLL